MAQVAKATQSESGRRQGFWPDPEHGADDWGGRPDQDEAEELQGASLGGLWVHRRLGGAPLASHHGPAHVQLLARLGGEEEEDQRWIRMSGGIGDLDKRRRGVAMR
ncbi:hypothetical protein TRIUR3_15026 [Triticum urartu]|uniref:Uncharacterized protein n=1 Tax=Triticum urartu TaxID=4572 RepID=M7Z2Q3_TRIUA|nr:hypothetical protein TRIUR3_15026 [Triticum urartu]